MNENVYIEGQDTITNKSVPKNIMKNLKILQLDQDLDIDKIKLIGSYSYKHSFYPSDIDSLEIVLKSYKEIVPFMVKSIKHLCTRMKKNKKLIFCELKMGIDKIFDVDVGEVDGDMFYPSRDLVEIINGLKKNAYISKEDHNMLIEWIRDPIMNQQLKYESLFNYFRDKKILRWSIHEIMKGSKKMVKNRTKILSDAVMDKGECNIECILQLNDKYTDISNYLVINYIGPNQEIYPLNFDVPYSEQLKESLKESLRKSIYILMNSKLDSNVFKSIKRMYSLFKMDDNTDVADQVLEIINGPLGYYNSIWSQSKLLLKLVSKFEIPNMKVLQNQLQTLKYMISKCEYLTNTEIDDYVKKIDHLYKKYSKPYMIKLMENLDARFHDILDRQSSLALKELGLYPFPPEMYPENIPF